MPMASFSISRRVSFVTMRTRALILIIFACAIPLLMRQARQSARPNFLVWTALMQRASRRAVTFLWSFTMAVDGTNWRLASDTARVQWTGQRLRDLSKFDCDAPRRRLALCHWHARAACWVVYSGSGQQGWTELHTMGELLYGPSPWRRSLVLPVFGRLGSVEAAVRALPAPGPDFAYSFEFEPDPERPKAGPRARYKRGMWDVLESRFFNDDAPEARYG